MKGNVMTATLKRWTTLLGIQTKLLMLDHASLVSNLTLAIASMVVFGVLLGGERAAAAPICVVDADGSPSAARVTAAFRASELISSSQCGQGREMELLKAGRLAAVVTLPAGFERDLLAGQTTAQVAYDATDAARGAQARSAVAAVIGGANRAATGAAEPIRLEDSGVAHRPMRQIDWLTPGMVGLMVMLVNLVVGATIILWRDRGVLKRLAVTPLRPLTLILTQIGARLILSLVQVGLLLAIARLLFGVEVAGSYVDLTLVVAAGTLAMLAFGFVIAAFVPKVESAQAVTSLVGFPMMLLGGSYFAFDDAPAYLRTLIDAMPMTYLNHALREVMLYGGGAEAVANDLLVLMAWMVASLFVATRAFRWE
jgi:ABC-2 type transport system permease protein